MFSLDSGQIQWSCEVTALESPEHSAHLSNTSWDTRVTCQAPSPHFAGQESSSVAVLLFNAQASQESPIFLGSREDFEPCSKDKKVSCAGKGMHGIATRPLN